MSTHGDRRGHHDATVGPFGTDGSFAWVCPDCDASGNDLSREEAVVAAAEHLQAPDQRS